MAGGKILSILSVAYVGLITGFHFLDSMYNDKDKVARRNRKKKEKLGLASRPKPRPRSKPRSRPRPRHEHASPPPQYSNHNNHGYDYRDEPRRVIDDNVRRHRKTRSKSRSDSYHRDMPPPPQRDGSRRRYIDEYKGDYGSMNARLSESPGRRRRDVSQMRGGYYY
ncbi:hypothetical protein MMC25_006301 [Agyrium rufum]|nr:hypothetical protein [Agyrium rufum]